MKNYKKIEMYLYDGNTLTDGFEITAHKLKYYKVCQYGKLVKKITSEKELKSIFCYFDCSYMLFMCDTDSKVDKSGKWINIILTEENEEKDVFERNYNRIGLPLSWWHLIRHIQSVFKRMDDSEDSFFDEELYNRGLRKNEIIYLSVVFGNGDKKYHYITNDETVKPGDLVTVPVGYDWQEKIARVVEKDYYDYDNRPRALKDTKEIIDVFYRNKSETKKGMYHD